MIDAAAQKAGVRFERCTLHGSRSRDHAFDVILSSHNGRQAGWGLDYQAATWDEWGIFLAYIFDADPDAVCWAYKSADDFHWQTGDRFRTLTRDQQCKRHKWGLGRPNVTHSYSVSECRKCGAVRRWSLRPASRIGV